MICFIDYLSFTFCPESLSGYKKSARLAAKADKTKMHKRAEKGDICSGGIITTSFSRFLESTLKKSDIDLLESECRSQLLRILYHSTKQFFIDAGEVQDAWDEVFTVRNRGVGMFGYRESYDLYFNGQQIGVACSGARNGGCLISFTGKGCQLLDMSKLQECMRSLPDVKITRADVAFDDFKGRYGYAAAISAYEQGLFTNRGRAPKCAIHATGELVKQDKKKKGKIVFSGGRTFEVGQRTSGKMLRVYEKGRQLGDSNSPWVRWEVEFRSSQRELPLFILTDPDKYFAGSYKMLAQIVEDPKCFPDYVEPAQIKTKKRVVVATYEHAEKSAKRIAGALINVMRTARGMSDTEIVNRLIGAEHSCPVNLRKVALSI
jgi:DNA relaxase NicK